MARYLSLSTVLLFALIMVWCADVSLAQWVEDGVPICTAAENQEGSQLVSDGTGGAIIVWDDQRSGYPDSPDIYAQRVNASGTVLWDNDGVDICTATGPQWRPQLVSDGAGGAIITWEDWRNGWDDPDIYAQRVDSSGTVLWDTNAVAICTAPGFQEVPQLISDGAGGVIIAWTDLRSGDPDIYAQRVNASGTVLWDTSGIAICTATDDQGIPRVASDGAGGAIISWPDLRSGDSDIYAQRVDASGRVRWDANGVPINTARESQYFSQLVSDGVGGAVITWYDSTSYVYRSDSYDIYAQRVDASGTVQWDINGVPICTATDDQYNPRLISDGIGGAIISWDDRRKSEKDIYAQRVESSGIVLWTVNGIPICTATDEQRYPRLISDGAGGAITIWEDYRSGNGNIYAQRVNALGLVQWTANGVAICTAAGGQNGLRLVSDGAEGAIITWTDCRSGNGNIYAQRVDHNGHAPPEGIPYNGQRVELPQAFSLSQNYPNPFNSITEIRYALPRSCQVKLEIYNILGQRVASLVDEHQQAGYKITCWESRSVSGGEISSGIYFYRLKVGDFVQTRKMVLLR